MNPCPHCKTTIKHGARFGCCSGCGWLFSSQSAFNEHQRLDGGRVVCADVEDDPRFVIAEKEGGRFVRLPAPERNPWRGRSA